ncbi:MAG: hypothetical protein AAGH53_01705 [Pseudomonadota bacterium]
MTAESQAPQKPASADTHQQGEQADKAPESIDTDSGETAAEKDNSAAKPPMVEQLTALYDDGRTWFEAELGFQKGRINYTVRAAKLGAIALGVGIFTLLCSYITLLLGMFMVVAHYFGPLIALLTVPLTWAVLGLLALRYAKSRITDTKAMIAETGGITGHKDQKSEENANG